MNFWLIPSKLQILKDQLKIYMKTYTVNVIIINYS